MIRINLFDIPRLLYIEDLTVSVIRVNKIKIVRLILSASTKKDDICLNVSINIKKEKNPEGVSI